MKEWGNIGPTKRKTINVDNFPVEITLIDTEGQEKYKTVTKQLYDGVSGTLVIYDITSSDSWDEINDWFRENERYSPKGTPMILVGNKSDLSERMIKERIARDEAARRNVQYFETSALDGNGVSEVFIALTRICLNIDRLE